MGKGLIRKPKLTKKAQFLREEPPFKGSDNPIPKKQFPRNFKAKQQSMLFAGLRHIGAPVVASVLFGSFHFAKCFLARKLMYLAMCQKNQKNGHSLDGVGNVMNAHIFPGGLRWWFLRC